MSERSRQLQVGFLFLFSVAVLVLGVLWFKEFRVGGTTYLVTVGFASTSGLIKGDPVEVQGVPSGKVEAIRFVDGRAVVTLRIDDYVTLYTGTRVVIENVGIMGQKLVAVYPGAPGPPLPRDGVLEGEYQAGVPQLMTGLGGTLETFERFAVRMDSLLSMFDEAQTGQLGRTLAHTERFTGELAALLGDNREELNESLRSTSVALGELRLALEGRGESIGEALDGAAAVAARLDTSLVTLDSAVTRLDGLLAKVEAGEGWVGKALRDEELYDELLATLSEAKLLLADIRENPRKYFKVSLF